MVEWSQEGKGKHMQQVAISDVDQAGAVVPPHVLRALGAVPGDTVAFVENDDGSISLMKAGRRRSKRSVGEFAGIFATGRKQSLAEDLTLLREIRYGDEIADQEAP